MARFAGGHSIPAQQNKKIIMKRHRTSQSGTLAPRVLLAVGLCSLGAWLAMFSFAAPTPSGGTAAQSPSTFQPVVIKSMFNGVSAAVRDLPKGLSTAQKIADE